MTKAKNKSKNIFIITIIFVIILFFGLVFKTNYNNSYVNTPNQNVRAYSSKFLKFSIHKPSEYTVEEKYTSVTLKKKKQEISIDRTGTNFDTIDGYINDLASKNRLEIEHKEKISINNNKEAMIIDYRTINNNEKIYIIYATDWTIFTLSASSKTLYPDLDQIARSFRYTP